MFLCEEEVTLKAQDAHHVWRLSGPVCLRGLSWLPPGALSGHTDAVCMTNWLGKIYIQIWCLII